MIGTPLTQLAAVTLALLAFAGCSSANPTSEVSQAGTGLNPDTPGFRPIRIGGGGYVADLDVSDDGKTWLARTDVHGAYLWDSSAREWKQLIGPSILPQLVSGSSLRAVGVYALRVAPSNSSRLYMAAPGWGGTPSTIYRSDDRGATWRKTGFTPAQMSVQSNGRGLGPKMAVSPVDPDLVLVGDSAGQIYVTHDGGQRWRKIDAGSLPPGAEPAIAFREPAPGSSKPPRIFAATGANGVYVSDDSGEHWARTNGGPNTVQRLAGSRDALYATDSDGTSLQNAWMYDGAGWTRIPIAAPGRDNSWHSVAVNRKNPRQVVLGTWAGNIASSADGGRHWGGFYNDAPARTARDVPWLAWTNEGWMSNGTMLFDPGQHNRLLFAEGIGVWSTDPPANDAKPTWVSQTRGIEELIVNDVIVPPAGAPLVAVFDRGIFRVGNPEIYAARHGPAADSPIVHTWAVDYAAHNPRFLAMIANGGGRDWSGFSTDGGDHWHPFPSLAPGTAPGQFGGAMAVSTDQNIVWFPSNNGRPFFTTDGGSHWQLSEFPGEVPTTGEVGWSFSMYQNRHIVAADRVRPNTFYAYNYGPWRTPAAGGIYRSQDGGAHWAKVAPNFPVGGEVRSLARLAAVPGKAENLFFAAGGADPSAKHARPFPLQFSADGGRTWQARSTAEDVWALGFGRSDAPEGYPTVFIAGFANGDKAPGIFCSSDQGRSWNKLATYPFGNVDNIRAVTGDMSKSGRVYFGFSGSGAGYGVFRSCNNP